MTKGITMATAKAVAAGNSCRQEDIIATANLSRRAITDMLHSCKVGRSWPTPESTRHQRARLSPKVMLFKPEKSSCLTCR